LSLGYRRPLGRVLGAPFDRTNWRALRGMAGCYPDFTANLFRYVTGAGGYPYACRVRTPEGIVAPTLYSHDDLMTLNEVFCREDYPLPGATRVVVDMGANIGLSALYFLTRTRDVRCHLYEPDPRNVERLRATLAGREDRFTVEEAAIGLRNGVETFSREPSGRYGRMGSFPGHEQIEVRSVDVNGALASVLRHEGEIDVLKIDVEGIEPQLIEALRPAVLSRIGVIYYETGAPQDYVPRGFDYSITGWVSRLQRRPDGVRPSDGSLGP
jgi:FkbM family methyltransferase